MKNEPIMTGKYEFQSTLHRTSRDMHRHMATAYMSAGGLNDAEAVRGFFETFTNEMIADGAEPLSNRIRIYRNKLRRES